MPRLSTAFLALCLALPQGALAADANGRFAAEGVGGSKCSDLTKAYEARDRQVLTVYASWADGFFTGFNISEDDTFDLTPWQGSGLTLSRLTAFCGRNPDAPFVEAAGKFMSVLKANRLTEGSEMIELRHGETMMTMYGAMLPRLKTALDEAGHPVEGPGDSFDDTFISALEAYQKEKGIEVTGLPDQPTLNALMR